MRLALGIVGESWEVPFARSTLERLRYTSPAEMILLPEELANAADETRLPVVPVPAPTEGFRSYSEIRETLLGAAPRDVDGVLLLAAGAFPERKSWITRLSAAYARDRVVEWIPAEPRFGASILHVRPPPHAPPARPAHRRRRFGRLDLWTVDNGDGYFSALLAEERRAQTPVYPQYGRGMRLFTYNTNRFRPVPLEPHDDYFIVASGLLGLRSILESHPRANARVVVYDIQEAALDWIRFLLAEAHGHAELPALIREFQRNHPSVAVREVLPHEESNAKRQREWYGENHAAISDLAKRLCWEFVPCDLLQSPRPLLERLRRGRATFLMHLDLFTVWHFRPRATWVEDHVGLVRSFTEAVRTRVGDPVTFYPRLSDERFELAAGSPFAAGRPSCT